MFIIFKNREKHLKIVMEQSISFMYRLLSIVVNIKEEEGQEELILHTYVPLFDFNQILVVIACWIGVWRPLSS